MQGRIINGFRSIWKTIKNEIFGPKINKKKLDIFKCIIQEKKGKINANIKVSSEKIYPNIRDINENFDVNIKDISFPSTVTKCNLLNEIFKLGNQSFNFVSKKYSIKGLEKGSFKKNIHEKNLNLLDKITKKIILNKDLKMVPIIKYDKKLQIINKVPKKVRCEHLGRYSKKELIRILKKAKMKKPKMDMTSFVIEALFTKIPVGNLQNLRYDSNTKEIYLYFNSRKKDKNFKDFVIFKNKLEQTNVKIFI
ncbi:MAG: hypothetical protein ACQERZ_01540 [Fusobacteriota bacterium]